MKGLALFYMEVIYEIADIHFFSNITRTTRTTTRTTGPILTKLGTSILG